jgi:hypothetical protein
MSIFHSLNMMKPVFWAFVCFIVWSESAKAAIDVFDNAEMTLTYHPQEQAFEYKLMLKGQFEGKTSFVFPHAWADGKDYRSFIADVVLNGEDVTSALSTEDPAIALTYTPSRVLSLSYKIKTKPFINIYTPTGDEELAQAPGHAIFAYPTRLPQLLRSYIQMSFNVPDGWDFLHPHRLEEGLFKGDPKEIVHALYMAKKNKVFRNSLCTRFF